MERPRLRKIARDFGGLLLVLLLLLLVYFLPPDTSLREVVSSRTLRACVPTSYPPLVTGDPDKPGADIEILKAIAERLGVELAINPNEAIGRDFNPRDWDVTRGKCQVLAGGVVASDLTRSFLDTGPPYAQTGWAILSPAPLADLRDRNIGALTILSGLDRIGLASYLRRIGAKVRVVPQPEQFVAEIADGRLDGGVTEALFASQIATTNGWAVDFLPELARYEVVFGLWKGDLTLKRAIITAFDDMANDGTLSAILARYGVKRIAAAGGPGDAIRR